MKNQADSPLVNKELKAALKSLQPLLICNTTEEQRFRDILLRTVASTGRIRRITRISPSSCVKWEVRRDEKGVAIGWPTREDDPKEIASPVEVVPESGISIALALRECLESSHNGMPAPDILWLANVDDTFNSDAHLTDLLLNAILEIRSCKPYKHILVTGTAVKCPPLLRDHCKEIHLPLPTEDEITSIVGNIIGRVVSGNKRLPVSSESLKKFIQNAKGLTETEVEYALAYCLAMHEGIDAHAPDVVHERKKERVRQSGVLEIKQVKKTLADVGGLERLKTWVDNLKPTFQDPSAAKAYGLRVPSGCLLMGPPGTGKSLSCEAIAGTLGIPMIRFSLGNCLGGLMGESENNLRAAFKTMEAVKPVLVQFDEVDRMLGSTETHNSTFPILKGMLLTWLEEKPEGIFVVMTCNDITVFNNPSNNALIRDKRIDATFFVDLPAATARMEIIKIHMERAGHPCDIEDLRKGGLVEATKMFNGAELESVVNASLAASFGKHKHPPVSVLLECAKAKTPQALAMKESFDAVRKWVKEGRAMLAGQSIEDDKSSAKADVFASITQ